MHRRIGFILARLILGSCCALTVGACLFVFDETDAVGGGEPYAFAPFDPSGSDQEGASGSRTCDWVDEDTGECTAPPAGISVCACPPNPDSCSGEGQDFGAMLWHCFESGGSCIVEWRNCGPVFDEFNRYPKQTCLENGDHGTGCYMVGTPDEEGYVHFCKDGNPCENGLPTRDCIKMPEFMGWDVTIPNVGGSEYSCFDDCFHYFDINGELFPCGNCCDACNKGYDEWQNMCEQAAPVASTTSSSGGGTCPGLSDNYPSTGHPCCDGCIDNLITCFNNNNCQDNGCASAYSNCITNTCNSCQ